MTTDTPPEGDARVGMLVYATSSPRCEGRLRERQEDFHVEEVIDLGGIRSEPWRGCVPVYRVEKRGVDTLHAARMLEQELRSRVAYAGLKDAKGVTVQFVSATSGRAESPRLVERRQFRAELVGFSAGPVSRGMLVGNRFRLVLRHPCSEISRPVGEVAVALEERRLPNFFGYQRFGLGGSISHKVGRAIVRRDFREAVRVFLEEPRRGEGERAKEARELAAQGRYTEARGMFSERQDVELRLINRVIERPDDPLGALRRVPVQLRRLLVNAYQSYIFNLTLSRAVSAGLQLSRAEDGDNWSLADRSGLRALRVHGVREPVPETALPMVQLVGYAFRDYGSRFDSIITKILAEEGVSRTDFYIKEADEMSREGGFRQPCILGGEFRSEAQDDGSCVLSFVLGKGEYATCVLREVLKPADPLLQGF